MADSGAGGRNNALAVRVLLSWWRSDCERNRKHINGIHWATESPQVRGRMFECLGVLNTRTKTFTVEGVMPQAVMPALTEDESISLVATLRRSLINQTGWVVNGLRREVVDWNGVNDIS